MTRRVIILFAVFAAALAASSMPAAALQTNTVLGSQHTTATDFNNATTLENASVIGSGNDAFVDFALKGVIDDFEDGGITEYTGDTGSFQVQSSTGVTNGSNALQGSASSGNVNAISDVDSLANVSQGDTVRFNIQFDTDDDQYQTGFGIQNEGGFTDGYWVRIQPDDNTLILQKRDGTVTVLDSTAQTYTANEQYEVLINWTRSGSITATLFDSSDTQLAQVTATDTTFETGGLGFLVNEIGSDTNPTVYWDHYRIPGGTGAYISQTHSVDNAVTAKANLSLANANATVTVLADTNGDGTFETEAATNTYSTTGNKSLDISGTDSTDWRLNVTVVESESNKNPTAELHDEGILFTNRQPTVDNSTGSPTGALTGASQTLLIQVNDTDFQTAQGDEVTAQFVVDGSPAGTDTLTANGTASVSHTFSGGDHTWSVTVTDAGGLANTSQDFSVAAPANITIREETEPHDIVKQATVSVLISGSGETVDKQTVNDGNVSLSGLSTTEEYVVLVNASGYHQRAILVQDVFDQSTVYILDMTKDSVENTFTIEDRSGNFPPSETKLIIEKPVNASLYDSSADKEYKWTTIGGDRLGADQTLTLALKSDARYRLTAQNDEGDERVLGEYTANVAGAVELRVGNVEVSPDTSDTYAWDANFTTVSGTKYIKFQFNDPQSDTSDLRLIIYEYGNRTNEIENSTHSGPFGTFSFTEDLSAISPAAENKTWVVEFRATRGGDSIAGKQVVGGSEIGTLPGITPMWLHVGSVGLLFLIGGLVGGLVNPGTGGVVVASVGGILWHVGALPSEVGGGVIALALIVSGAWLVVSQGAFR